MPQVKFWMSWQSGHTRSWMGSTWVCLLLGSYGGSAGYWRHRLTWQQAEFYQSACSTCVCVCVPFWLVLLCTCPKTPSTLSPRSPFHHKGRAFASFVNLSPKDGYDKASQAFFFHFISVLLSLPSRMVCWLNECRSKDRKKCQQFQNNTGMAGKLQNIYPDTSLKISQRIY